MRSGRTHSRERPDLGRPRSGGGRVGSRSAARAPKPCVGLELGVVRRRAGRISRYRATRARPSYRRGCGHERDPPRSRRRPRPISRRPRRRAMPRARSRAGDSTSGQFAEWCDARGLLAAEEITPGGARTLSVVALSSPASRRRAARVGHAGEQAHRRCACCSRGRRARSDSP